MKNFVKPAVVVTAIAPAGGAVSGTGYLIGTLFGVAGISAAAGAEFEMQIVGQFKLPKVAAQAWTQFANVYWDDTAKNVTTTASGNTLIGKAAYAQLAAAVLADVIVLPR